MERTFLRLLVAWLSSCLPKPEGDTADELQYLRLRQQGPQAPVDLHREYVVVVGFTWMHEELQLPSWGDAADTQDFAIVRLLGLSPSNFHFFASSNCPFPGTHLHERCCSLQPVCLSTTQDLVHDCLNCSLYRTVAENLQTRVGESHKLGACAYVYMYA